MSSSRKLRTQNLRKHKRLLEKQKEKELRHKDADKRRESSKIKKEVREFFNKIKIKGKQESSFFGILDHTGVYQ